MPFTTYTLPVVTIALAAFGLGCSSIASDAVDRATLEPAPIAPVPVRDPGPVACSLDVSAGLFGLTFAGIAKAHDDVDGTYDLVIRKSGRSGSATINQGGPFSLRAGQSETLGEATLSGNPSEFDAELALTVNGKRVVCSDTGLIDL